MTKIAIGHRVGALVVSEKTDARKNGYTIWRCKCDCGGTIDLDTRTLQRETVRDCGCATKVVPGTLDLAGMRFGKLVAIEQTDRRVRTSVVWRCKCDCGQEKLVTAHQLTYGYTKSCGCLARPPLKDFIGKTFGRLTVLAYAGKKSGMHQWRCRCDCGQETVVGQSRLQSGKTKSCGCMQATIYRENMQLMDGTSLLALKAAKKLRSTNTSGHVGVYQEKRSGKWRARITFKGKVHDLGSYDTLEEAVRARQRGEEMHDEFLEKFHIEEKAQ